MRKIQRKFKKESLEKRHRRKLSTRARITGTVERPRICATKTNKNLFIQIIDDVEGKTLLTAQTFGKKGVKDAACNKDGAKIVGVHLAGLMKEKKIEKAVFDRNGNKYCGVIAVLADSLREQGIQI